MVKLITPSVIPPAVKFPSQDVCLCSMHVPVITYVMFSEFNCACIDDPTAEKYVLRYNVGLKVKYFGTEWRAAVGLSLLQGL